MSESVAEHLARAYGARAWEVCDLAASSGLDNDKQLLSKDFPYLEADVIWACREYACTIEDVLSRRTRLAFLNKDAATDVIPVVADIMAKELGWSGRVKKEQIKAARQYLESYEGRIAELSEDSAKIASS